MQIFGQVWLWSLGSFLLGVLFTWLLLVRPARSRVVELEDAARRTPQQPRQGQTRVAEPVAEPEPGPNSTDRFLDDLFESQRTPPLPPSAPVPPVSAVSSTQQTQVVPVVPPVAPPPPAPKPVPATAAAQSGPVAPPEPPLPDESDTELSDPPFSQFTHSTTVFVPPELPRPVEVTPGGEDWFAKEEEPGEQDPHAITDVEDDETVDERGTIFSQHTTPIPAGVIRSLDESQPEPVRPEEPAQEAEPVVPAAETTQYIEPQAAAPVELAPEPSPAPLPRRVPKREREAAAAAAAAQQPPAESGRSLFEPVVPAGDNAEDAGEDFVPPGPFGPGSAMPLPGGGAPAPDFNVKASVTALRYCTQDNPQFDRIVAEVWFRTPSDAERVGFRVLS